MRDAASGQHRVDGRGVRPAGRSRGFEPEDVANEIVDALEVPRFDVFVPRWLKATVVTGNLLPRRAREAVARFMGVDKVLTEVDHGARRDYEERAAKSRAADAEAEAEAERNAA